MSYHTPESHAKYTVFWIRWGLIKIEVGEKLTYAHLHHVTTASLQPPPPEHMYKEELPSSGPEASLLGFGQSETQTSLLSYRVKLEH